MFIRDLWFFSNLLRFLYWRLDNVRDLFDPIKMYLYFYIEKEIKTRHNL